MANTTVTDALFMANVTQVNAIENSKKLQAEGVSFAQAMGDASSGKIKADTQTDTFSSQPATKTLNTNSNKNLVKEHSDGKRTEEGKEEPGKMEGAAKETVKKADDIKKEVKDTFGASDEEIEQAMQTLGLMAQDLLNPDSLKDLMMELSGVSDSLELLTNADLYQGMQNILEDAAEMVESIMKEFNFTEDDFAALLENDNLFSQAIVEMEDPSFREESFGPIEENEAIRADVPDARPERGKATEITDGNKKEIEVLVTKDGDKVESSDNSKTETFKTISQTEKTELNNEQNMAGMTREVTTVTVNELGEVVETVQSFSSAFDDVSEIASQVTQRIKIDFSADTTSMEMQLHPATLGTVNMQISSQNGVVTAHLLVQNEAVKAALESQLVQLKETFEEQGRTVEAVEVSVANYDLDRGMQQNANDQEREQALRFGRAARRRLRLDDISEDEIDDLDDNERIAADMMRRQGNSLDFMA